MRMRRLFKLTLIAFLVALFTAPAPASAGLSESSFNSTALAGTVHYGLYLPPSYASSPRKRYPVIYFLHGLPAQNNTYSEIYWLGQAMEQSGRDAIVIGVEGTRDGDEYPQYLNRGSGENWETASSSELVSVVDQRYRTLRSRYGRAIIGASAGGYGATMIGFHHPGLYSVIQSWSGYFRANDEAGRKVIDLGSHAANERANMHALVPKLHSRLGKKWWKHTHYSFYVGAGDDRFRSDNERLHRELAHVKLPGTRFRIYPGTHGVGLWEDHAHDWIGLATKQLRRAG
jgi:S-formylglutathione hydrolase FrmB